MKQIILIIAVMLCAVCAYSQKVWTVDASGNYVQKEAVYSSAEEYAKAHKLTATGKKATDAKGNEHPVYTSAAGKLGYVAKNETTGKYSFRGMKLQ